ncbi:MAG TPA: hypothetical protein VKK79_16435 [Candidatus Lokiarchaeia archaeon]|nr:hypothetical protein [Candidatus Lokiarchaeia archaeon]
MEEAQASPSQFDRHRKSEFSRVNDAIARAGPLVFFGILLPECATQFLTRGLSGTTLVIVGGCVMAAFLAIFLGKATTRVFMLVTTVARCAAGGLCFLAGLLLEVGFDGQNVPAILALSGLLVASFLSVQADFMIRPAESEPKGKRKANLVTGIAIMSVVFGVVYLFAASFMWLFYAAGAWYLAFTPTWFRLRWAPAPDSGTNKVHPDGRKGNWIAPLLVLLLAGVLMSFGPFAMTASTYGWSLLILPAPILIWAIILPKARKNGILIAIIISVAGLIIGYLLFLINQNWIQGIPIAMLLGFVIGANLPGVSQGLTAVPKQHYVRQGLKCVFCLFLEAAVWYAGMTFQRNLVGMPALLEWGLIVLASVGGGAIILSFVVGKRARATDETPQKAPQVPSTSTQFAWTSAPRVSRVVWAVCIALLVAMPSITWALQQNSREQVVIVLPVTMYDVFGNPVTTVTLGQRTAEILLYSPHPVGIAHGEVIRPGMSVRLGAYFYGLDGVSVSDMDQWIGNNLDVFSLGFYGDVASPSDILAIRALNPLVKFYYMTYATTLFENASAPADFYGSNLTHFPAVKFNDTINSWTLKLKNGSETIAVRRDSPTSNTHVMDLGQMGWADFFAFIYSQRVNAFHADGVAIDEVMWRGYWGTQVSDLRDYTSLDQIIATCYAWLARLRADTSMEIITQAYWDEAQQYQNGVWGETAFRAGGQYGDRVDDRNETVWYESNTWQGIVANLASAGERNRSYIWGAWYDRADPSALEYSVATYLMAKPNNCVSLGFAPQPIYAGGYPANLAGYSVKTMQEEVANHPEFFNLQMGDALGPMQQIQGIGGLAYQRNFTNGIVLVNPYHAAVPGFG